MSRSDPVPRPRMPPPWVVKLGGSLFGDPLLRAWLDRLATAGAGRVVVVPGGGAFADAVRQSQQRWRFADLAAHNMAVLAMVQGACLLQALQPTLRSASREADIDALLQAGHPVVWAPFDLLRSEPDAGTNWGATSDTIALALALRLGAARLVVVKSCAIDPALGPAALALAGVLDTAFAQTAHGAELAIDIVQKDAVDRVGQALRSAGYSQR